MSGPRSYEQAITAEKVNDHDRRIVKAEENISETKKAVFQIEKAIVKLEAPMKWIEKLAFMMVVGVAGILLTQVASLIFKRAP